MLACLILIRSSVPLPMMPFGVEHFAQAKEMAQIQLVPLPLMPVGVEHNIVNGFRLAFGCAFTFDATRR